MWVAAGREKNTFKAGPALLQPPAPVQSQDPQGTKWFIENKASRLADNEGAGRWPAMKTEDPGSRGFKF